MRSVKNALKGLRYFDSLIIRGKRVVVGEDYEDPCNHWGHEDVLAFATVYCNDTTVREDAFRWDSQSVEHLGHITKCSHCLSRVFSVPSPRLSRQGLVLLRAVS